MNMGGEDNVCSSGLGLWATMSLGKLEDLLHLLRSQVKRRQWGVMMHGPPPSLVGKRLQRTGLSLYNTSTHATYSGIDSTRSHLPFQPGWNAFAPACTQ